MYFRDPKKELPEPFQKVLIKCSRARAIFPGYYSARFIGGEFNEFDAGIIGIVDRYLVDCWIPLSEIDSIEIK